MADIAAFSIARNSFNTFDPTATTGDMTTGAASQTVEMDTKKDHMTLIYVINTSATAGDDVLVTVSAGNGKNSKGVALSATVGDGESTFIGPLDSMDFVNESGTNAGKMVITAAKATEAGTGLAGDVKLCAIHIK